MKALTDAATISAIEKKPRSAGQGPRRCRTALGDKITQDAQRGVSRSRRSRIPAEVIEA